MLRKKTPPSNGESGGPRMVACQWKGSSPTGPALHWAGGSLAMSFNSLLILFKAISETGDTTGLVLLGYSDMDPLDPSWDGGKKGPF